MAGVRRSQEQQGRLPFVLALLVSASGIGLLWLRLPTLLLTVVGLSIAGVVHPAPELTGSQGSGASRRAVPDSRSQRRALARHTRISGLRTLAVPTGLWPVQTALLAAVGAALAAGSLAVVPPPGWPAWVGEWGPWVNAVCAFVLVAGGERVWRSTLSCDEAAPGTPVALVARAPRVAGAAVLVGAAGGCLVCVVAGVSDYWVSSPVLACAGAAVVGAAGGVWLTCRRGSWEPWRLRERARRLWGPRWAMVPREEQPPALVRHESYGPLVIDTFRARPGRDLEYYVKISSQIGAAVGDGSTVRVLPAPVVDSAGQSQVGTVDPTVFAVAVLPPGVDEEMVEDPNALAAFQWAGRWAQVPRMLPAPVLVERSVIGPYTVDLFEAPGRPSSEVLHMSDRVGTAVGAGLSAVVVPEPDKGHEGRIHPTRFRVTVCDPAAEADVATSDVDVVRVRVERFLTEAADYLHQDVVALSGLELLTVDGPRVWRVELADSGAATRLGGLMEQIAPTLVDGAAVLLGQTREALWRDPGMAGHVEDLHVADEWTAHFREVIKMGDTPPVAQVAYLEELEAGGVPLYRLPFASPQGKDLARDYLHLGQRLRTTMPQAPFLLVTAIPPTEGASAPGVRSDKFFEVVWSTHPVASTPADLPPSRTGALHRRIDPRDGATLVLAGMVDAAFRAAFKDGQAPQTVSAQCLTVCAPWIWCVRVRLYGGLNLADLRRRADRIAALMRADWIRLRGDGDLVDLFVGAIPMMTRVASEHVRTVAELDFEQAWAAARMVTSAGEVPRMESMEPLDGNEAVTVYTFTLPAGLSRTDVVDSLDKISSTTGAGFLQVVTHPDPSRVVLMGAARNPIPARAAYDFEATDALVARADGVGSALLVPWGTGVDGRPVTWRVKDTPHALVLGITGTGKSVTLLAAVYATLLAGWDVMVIDPVKGGADFAGLAPWLCGLGGASVSQAEAMMRAVYAEVVRRKNLVAEHGVPDIEQLPDDVRPPHVLVAIDEFTSLMLHEPVRRARTTDPDVLADYEQAEQANAKRASIGSLAGRVAREARSSGVHLLLGTQVLKADTIARIPGGDLKNNLGRLLLGTPTQGERMSGLRQPDAAPVLSEAPTGRGVWEATTSPGVEMQTWYATVSEYAQALTRRGVATKDDWDVEAFMTVQEAPAYSEIDDDGDVEVLDELVIDEL